MTSSSSPVSTLDPMGVACMAGVATLTVLAVAVAAASLSALAFLGAPAMNLALPAILGHAPVALMIAGKLTFAGKIAIYGSILVTVLVAALIAALATELTLERLDKAEGKIKEIELLKKLQPILCPKYTSSLRTDLLSIEILSKGRTPWVRDGHQFILESHRETLQQLRERIARLLGGSRAPQIKFFREVIYINDTAQVKEWSPLNGDQQPAFTADIGKVTIDFTDADSK